MADQNEQTPCLAYVKYPYIMGKDAVEQMLRKCGPIKYIKGCIDPVSNTERNFCFVEFDDVNAAAVVSRHLTDLPLQPWRLHFDKTTTNKIQQLQKQQKDSSIKANSKKAKQQIADNQNIRDAIAKIIEPFVKSRKRTLSDAESVQSQNLDKE
ncbi:hypothetical protein MIR68_010964 [Amoeboaphelidium protococcarum]|nr:hypothetical protein MIR68_010964 [Amoeboaphelidium protococcarum]